MTTPLIEARGVAMHFGGVQAIRGVDFTLAKGELRCLIGPNGAGKSTFFKLLTGQIKPTGGSVLFEGTDITQLQAHEIARLGIGVKTQVPSLFNGLSVRENLMDRRGAPQKGQADRTRRGSAGRSPWSWPVRRSSHRPVGARPASAR